MPREKGVMILDYGTEGGNRSVSLKSIAPNSFFRHVFAAFVAKARWANG
jgi:hypothetical protein